MDNIEIQVKIELIDKDKNQIIYKPYSPEFKNKIEEYPFIAVDITSLDLSQSIKDQLLKRSTYYIKEILFKENNEKFLKNLNDINIEADTIISKQISTKELFAPETINTETPQPKPQSESQSESQSTPPLEVKDLESTDIFTVVK
jgi:hypothetical protein